MPNHPVIYYDYEHCREFLEARARDLKQAAQGLDSLALYRELYYSFSYEALEKNTMTLGQFDSSLVYLFIPSLDGQPQPSAQHEVARAKALELLQSSADEPPLVFELLASQTTPTEVGIRGRIDRWMRPEFLTDVLYAARVQIHIYFHGAAFFHEMLCPPLEQYGFTKVDGYVASARSGELRVRHPEVPGKLFRIPWVLWVREMIGGGYSVLFLAACIANYFQKLEGAVAKQRS